MLECPWSFTVTKLHLSKYNCSHFVSVKQNMNFNFSYPLRSYFNFHKNFQIKVIWKSISILNFIVQYLLVQLLILPPTFVTTILECLKLRSWKVWHWCCLQWHDLRAEFHKIYLLIQKLFRGYTNFSLTFIFKNW